MTRALWPAGAAQRGTGGEAQTARASRPTRARRAAHELERRRRARARRAALRASRADFGCDLGFAGRWPPGVERAGGGRTERATVPTSASSAARRVAARARTARPLTSRVRAPVELADGADERRHRTAGRKWLPSTRAPHAARSRRIPRSITASSRSTVERSPRECLTRGICPSAMPPSDRRSSAVPETRAPLRLDRPPAPDHAPSPLRPRAFAAGGAEDQALRCGRR